MTEYTKTTKVPLAPVPRTFERVVKGTRMVKNAASKTSRIVDVFKQYDLGENLRQLVVSNGKYQTVFNYDKDEQFQSMVIQDKNGNIYAKFSKTPQGYVVQKAPSVSCKGLCGKTLNTPFSLDGMNTEMRFFVKDKEMRDDFALAHIGIPLGNIGSFYIPDAKGMYDVVRINGSSVKPYGGSTIRETELSYIETTPNHPKEIQIISCKDKDGRPAVRVLDEKGKEIYTRVQNGENDFEQIYPNGLHSRIWKEKDGTNMNLIWDPRDPTAGYIKKKDGRVVSENKGTGALRQKIAELQKTGRNRGQILNRLQRKRGETTK